jgi:hypothetical protein
MPLVTFTAFTYSLVYVAVMADSLMKGSEGRRTTFPANFEALS